MTEQDKTLSDYGLKILQLEQKLGRSQPATPAPPSPTKKTVLGTAKKRKLKGKFLLFIRVLYSVLNTIYLNLNLIN